MSESIHLLYTNDFHSNFRQWPRVANYIKQIRSRRERNGEQCFLVDIGDHADRTHLLTDETKAQANVRLLNSLQYDVITIGNNEGITLGRDDFYHLYDDAQFQVVVSNLLPVDFLKPEWLLESTTIETRSGISIGFLGLTAPFNAFYHLLGWHAEDPFKVLRQSIQTIRRQHDIVILLSHLGLDSDEMIAREFPEIDLIIGGHTHHLLKHGKQINQTVLTAAGKHCYHVGEVTIQWNDKTNEIIQIEATAIDLTEETPDLITFNELEALEREIAYQLDEPITTLMTTYRKDWFQETKPLQLLTEGLRLWTDADCAMLNGGLLLEDFKQGPITKRHVHAICPHPINPVVVELTGQELTEVVRAARSHYIEHFPLVGFGFRGEVLGRFTFAHLTIAHEVTNEAELFIHHIFLNGEQLQPDKLYKLATADSFTFGDLFPPIRKAKVKHYFVPEFLKDLLIGVLKGNLL